MCVTDQLQNVSWLCVKKKCLIDLHCVPVYVWVYVYVRARECKVIESLHASFYSKLDSGVWLLIFHVSIGKLMVAMMP